MNKALVDTSFLYGSFDENDKYHEQAIAWGSANPNYHLIIADVVLVEATYLIQHKQHTQALINFLKDFVISSFHLEALQRIDIANGADIMERYRDANLDFVDCVLMAQAERLNITQICTFDRRDFSLVKPRHCDYFDLLP